jgi:alkylation response protein AidB-like acyl-CoA dehydrogenase
MDLRFPTETVTFREHLRSWIASELPEGWGKDLTDAQRHAAGEDWSRRMHASGWSCPTWPTEYGGRGLSMLEAAILDEEMEAAKAPLLAPTAGKLLVGPTILALGTDAQRRRFLPSIAHGTEVWCQGFSEPDSGSDLASLTTTATLDGDEWVVDGEKIWTSEAPDADFVFLLARTDPDASRHRGISYLLVPMHQPGIEVVPICQPDGTAGFNRVRFAGARCPAANIVGAPGEGWKVANSTLTFERGTNTSTGHRRFEVPLARLLELARVTGRADDPVVRQRVARVWAKVNILRFHDYRGTTAALHPQHQAAQAALSACIKLYWTELDQELTELAIDLVGPAGVVLDGQLGAPPPFGVGMGRRPAYHDYPAGPAQLSFLFARSGTIFGGTSEIQRSIIAERVLGLPREPRG